MRYASIHIPKTAGTSFHAFLSNYFDTSHAIKRREVADGSWLGALSHEVVHGHVTYKEFRPFLTSEVRLLTWLRDPVARVVSNYRFFIRGLNDPNYRNPTTYAINAHRKSESLLEYAAREETQNVMTKYLAGAELNSLFFIGLVEDLEGSMNRLSALLSPEINAPTSLDHLNKLGTSPSISSEIQATVSKYNQKDIDLYQRALHELKQREL